MTMNASAPSMTGIAVAARPAFSCRVLLSAMISPRRLVSRCYRRLALA
jgi:hypothetical protein